jgi:hypothetical protein
VTRDLARPRLSVDEFAACGGIRQARNEISALTRRARPGRDEEVGARDEIETILILAGSSCNPTFAR